MDKKPKRHRGVVSTDPPAPQPRDAAFDKWLEDRLKTAYSSVLDEPIPEDLIRLLTQKLKG